MIDIIRGASNKPVSTEALIDFVEKSEIDEAILYTGYPIVGSIEGISSLDALLISSKHGVIVFDIVEEPEYSAREDIRDSLYNIIFQKLIGHKVLSEKRGKLKIEIYVLTIAPSWIKKNHNEEIIKEDDLKNYLRQKERDNLSFDDYKQVIQVVQAITKLKAKPAREITDEKSKGAILNDIEKSISNLDRMQSRAVIETVDGVQRIRGLAGSGKTIVLALKVAYLHSKFPDWTIGVTYYTRSLKNQFKELITKFTIEHKNEEPDWNKIKIQPAWGSFRESGIYYEFCKVNNVEYLDYDSAKIKFGPNETLDKLSEKALSDVKSNTEKALSEAKSNNEIYDIILIDEAQDFTESFLRLCYSLLKPISSINLKNKRLIYAYDELQKLNESRPILRNPTDIFSGINFTNQKNKPQNDIILEKCYRNSSPILVTAHALGFGIYREEGLVTMFRDKELWTDVGYIIDDGELELGKKVTLKRDEKSSPDFLTEKISTEEIIRFKSFDSIKEQYEYIVTEIEKNLKEEDLTYRDIIVIHPNPLNAKNELAGLRGLLFEKEIESHMAGVNTSPDDFFIDNSIVFTSIFRAKGNEAAMIYVVGSEHCYGGNELIKKRNTLFTAITRSKAWVRVLGVGNAMRKLEKEFNKVKENDFKLKFNYPTVEEMENLNVLHRDLSDSDKKNIAESKKAMNNIVKKIRNKEIHIEDIIEDMPKDIRIALMDKLNDNK